VCVCMCVYVCVRVYVCVTTYILVAGTYGIFSYHETMLTGNPAKVVDSIPSRVVSKLA
jgi:hypothetical protein